MKEKDAKKVTSRKKHSTKSRKAPAGFPVKQAGIIAGGTLAVLVLIYLGVSVFFMSHFYTNTKINGKDFSGKSAAAVETYMKEQVKGYELTIKEQGNQSDRIKRKRHCASVSGE